MTRVYVDPGHGGHDPGAVDGKSGSDSIYTEEEDRNLSIGLHLRDALVRCGFTVKMSRTGDTFPSLADRYNGANAFDADSFVSIHCDSSAASVKGIHAIYRSEKGKQLGTYIMSYLDDVSPWADRGVHEDTRGLAVLRGTNMPAILVEYGFISNTAEEALLATDSYRKKLAEATARGICKFHGKTYVSPVSSPTKPTSYPHFPGRVLRYKLPLMRGTDVKLWQGKMSKRGYNIKVDGVYGSQSRSICKTFQKKHGLTVDGKVGPVTWKHTWTG